MKKYVKCVRCGWKYGNIYHCCYVASAQPVLDLEATIKKGRRSGGGTSTVRNVAREAPFYRSDEHRSSMSLAQSARWDAYRAINAERDRQIVEKYNAGNVGYNDLAREYGISRSTVIKVMRSAAAAGIEVHKRPPGRSIKNGA